MARGLVVGLVAFVAGMGVSGAALTAFPRKTDVATREPTKADQPEDGDALRRANANLTESLQVCDRKLEELRSAQPVVPPAASAEAPRDRDGGRGRRSRGEPTTEDWERMAELGAVRVRVPCVRDTPWTPSERVANRLGLAPSDTQALKEAYEKSNKRVVEAVRPLCAKVLGSAEVADKVGTSACMDAIQNSARKGSPEKAREALTNVAQVQAGKRQAGAGAGDASPLEQLALSLTNESKAFENDLAQKLGPEEAKRLAWDPALCSDRRTFRATDERDPGAGPPDR